MFQLQTSLREDIKEKSDQRIRDLIEQAETESAPSEELHFLFVKLRKQLAPHKGKKVYGYLPKQIKATVNEIVDQLSMEPSIEELYKEWNKINREKLSLYFENKGPTVPLVDNKEFRSIKNIIIRAVMKLPPEVEMIISDNAEESKDDDSDPVHPRFHKEETVLKIPKAPNSTPVIIQPKDPVSLDAKAAAKGIIGALARWIGDMCMARRQTLQGQIDHRLRLQINEKKLAMGLKIESIQKASYQTEEEYKQSM